MAFYSNPKKKHYVLNPQGKALFEDTNRFGTKMLEKMGWSKGKGLGANLDGSQEFIRISFKGDQQGLGFVDRDDQWTQHESSFNSLLKSLDNSDNSNDQKGKETPNDEVEEENSKGNRDKIGIFSGKSLEEQSKLSRARVHYKKFTRGKDMSRYKEQDLANIFGKKSLDNEINPIVLLEVEPEEEKLTEVEVPNFGITTVETGMSVTDYFKNKLKKIPTSSLDMSSNKIETNEDKEQTKQRRKTSTEDMLRNENKTVKKKKKNKKNEEDVNDDFSESVNAKCSLEMELKKNKKRKHRDIKIKDEDNSHQISKDLKGTVKMIQANNFIENEVKKKKKRKHRESESQHEESTESSSRKIAEDISQSINNEDSIEIKVKSKKKKKNKNPEIEETISSENLEQNLNKNFNAEMFETAKSLESEGNRKKKHKEKDQQPVPTAKKKDKKELKLDLSPEIFVTSLFEILSSLNGKSFQIDKQSESDTNEPESPKIEPESPQNTMEIGSYQAEIFRNTNVHGFCDSSFTNIYGYGYGPNLKLNIITKSQDERRIRSAWDQALWDKYGAVLKTKIKKKKKLTLHRLNKKNVFKGLL